MKQKKIRRQPQKKPSPRQQKPRKREDGRPQGTLKRFPFDETRIGFMLRYEMPVVYHLLRRLCATQQPFEPDWQVIRSVAEASKDPSCGKAKFRRYLDEYRRDGVYCRRGKRLTPERKAYYEGIFATYHIGNTCGKKFFFLGFRHGLFISIYSNHRYLNTKRDFRLLWVETKNRRYSGAENAPQYRRTIKISCLF